MAGAAGNYRLYRYLITGLQPGNARSYRHYIAGDFVPHRHRQRRSRMLAFEDVQVTAAQGYGTHSNQYVLQTKLWHWA